MKAETFIMIYAHIPSIYTHKNFMFHVRRYSFGKINVNQDFFDNDFNNLLKQIADYLLKTQQAP